jgi:membrane protein
LKIRIEIPAWIKNAYKTVDSLFDRIAEHHTFLIASGLAFNILLYLIPMFLLAIFVIGSYYDSAAAVEALSKLFENILPPGFQSGRIIDGIFQEVEFILDKKNIAGIIGFVSTLWLASALLSSLRAGLNLVFGIESKRIFIIYRLKDLLLALILMIFILIISFLYPAISYLKLMLNDTLPEFFDDFFFDLADIFGSLILSFLFFVFIYKFIPGHSPEKSKVLLSSLICSFLVEVSRNAFAWYSAYIANYSKFYGGYAIIVTLALWIFYLSFIILFSAEIGVFVLNRIGKKSKTAA